jgi:hypothetical protein
MEVNNNLWSKLGITGYYSNPYAYYYLHNEIVTFLPEYEEFRCIQCGKFSEELALKSWINPLLRVKSKSSLTSTKDGVVLANRDFKISTKIKVGMGCYFCQHLLMRIASFCCRR